MTPPGKPGHRVFIALDPPRAVRSELAGWLRTVSLGPAARPVPPDRMHLTLHFLGDRSEHEVEIVSQSMLDLARSVGELASGAPAWLPRRKPRALAVEIRDEDDRLGDLHRDLTRELSAAIDLDEPRRFRPHITIARFGRGARPGGDLPPTPAVTFHPESLTLYRSILSPEGASYEALARAELGPAAG